MLASISSAVLRGVDGIRVTVEVHVAGGLPSFTVVGLPDASCREARDRVRAAVVSSGLPWPQQRITVNLAPSGLPKAGAGLDLPMAIGVLVASGVVPSERAVGIAFVGELGLDGSLRRIAGLVPLVEALPEPIVVVPPDGQAEAMVLGRHEVRAAATLAAVVAALRGLGPWETAARAPAVPHREPVADLADVRGQPMARRAVEVAAAGGHHLLMVGPPGAGKTMLAQRLVGLLPPLDADAALQATKVHSAAGETLPEGGLLRNPPLRAPHHNASMAALVGGGSAWLRPGEISLATGGVLFLDELAEFSPAVLDALRQPLEEGRIRVARAHGAVQFPARFLLVAATNPCPCGNAGGDRYCRCSAAARRRYRRRLSAPLLDRFDLRIAVHRPDPDRLTGASCEEGTEAVAARVAEVRAITRLRGVSANRELSGGLLDRHAVPSRSGRQLLTDALRRQRVTARGVDRIRRVARTLADLDGARGCELAEEHIALAMHLRADTDQLLGVDE
ncbi:MAG: YifB family Mg chelatase-like AAA ATPase [Acidimicrobiales bacterium]|nr:YifB family Mg chelatase-like AAA ATPase [Acidimicrobiales bacterium]